MNEKIIAIVANRSGLVRNDKMEGQDYLVVPMVMIVEGVLPGSEGAMFYPGTELAKFPAVWNHKPVVVYHPEIAGVGVSACSPEILTQQKIGVIMNTTYDAGKLKAEAWINVNRANEVDPRIMKAVDLGQMMELSTGLYTEQELSPGEFNGKNYTAIARNYRPDHLAILPDQVGACSIEDGAGFLRLNSKGLSQKQLTALKTVENYLDLKTNELSHSALESKIQMALELKFPAPAGKEFSPVWIRDVFDKYVVYSNDGKLFKIDFSQGSKDEVTLVGEAVEVVRKTTYDPVVVKNANKEQDMNKKELVDKLIGNKSSIWEESNREMLMTLNEEQLTGLAAQEEPAKEETTKEQEEPAKEETTVTNTSHAKSLEEFIGSAPAEMQDVLRDSLVTHNQKRQELITVITSNKSNLFKSEQLAAMGLGELQAIAALARNEKSTPDGTTKRAPVYFPMPTTNTSGKETTQKALPRPTLNFTK